MKTYLFVSAVCASLLLTSVALPPVAAAQGRTYTDPAKVDADYAVQGEYVGSIKTDDGEEKLGVQVIALGKGEFAAVSYTGGLPGDGWDRKEPPMRIKEHGKRNDNGDVVFDAEQGRGVIKNGVLTITVAGGKGKGQLKRVQRKSKTLNAKPPRGAVVLFDGKGVDKWKPGKMTGENLLEQGATSIPKFGDHTLHIEFRTPYKPLGRSQGRGNSGVYVQGKYEVQVLDSFGLEGKMNECGGIYSVKDTDFNMCFPPLTWQTYDIDYTAAKYDAAGKLTSSPKMTVRHNGVVIHKDVELPGNRNTTAAPVKAGPSKGPVYLQNHGNPVRYRNIWVVER